MLYNRRNYFSAVTVMWGSNANPNPTFHIQIFLTLETNKTWLLWFSPMTLVHDMCGSICLEKNSFSVGKNSFLAGSQAIRQIYGSEITQNVPNHVIHLILSFTCPKQSFFFFFHFSCSFRDEKDWKHILIWLSWRSKKKKIKSVLTLWWCFLKRWMLLSHEHVEDIFGFCSLQW